MKNNISDYNINDARGLREKLYDYFYYRYTCDDTLTDAELKFCAIMCDILYTEEF